jgi:hypothetical protein
MKKTILAAMGLAAFIAFVAFPAGAQEGKEKKPAPKSGESHSHFTKIPEAVEDVWKEIHKQHGKLVATVAKKDLGEAHDHAFAIRDLVKALPGKVSADNKTKAEESAKEIAKIAGDIDKSGAAGAQKATETNVKKMEEAIKELQAKIKPAEVKK